MGILVLEARGLHIGFLGCYGNEWIATPNLDRLAAEGVVFDQHILDRPRAAPAGTASLLEPDARRRAIPMQPIASFGRTVVSAWRQSNEELVWIDGPNLGPPWDLPEDLRDVYFDEDEEGEPWPDPPTDIVGALSIDELLELQNTYAAAVTWFDAQVGVVLDALRESGDLEQTLVCVTAGSGLPLGEHGQIGAARAWLHEELIHVPLLIRFPSQQHAGLRIQALTQPPDLLKTLQPGAAGGSGHDLMPLLRHETESVRPHACTALQIGGSIEWSLRTAEWAFLLPIQVPEGDVPRAPQLYVKPADRWEVNDVRQHNPELAEELEKALRFSMEAPPEC